MANNKFLSVRELAEKFNVPVAVIYASVAEGKLPHIRLRKHIRFNPEAIEAWVAAEQEATRG